MKSLAKRVWGCIRTRYNIMKNIRKNTRRLEIGPGCGRIEGFETLDVVYGENVDYVLDANHPLPFKDDTFDLVYASHVIEHIAWYKTENFLREIIRILKPGGWVEVWVPDGLKICSMVVEYELNGVNDTAKDGWYKFNPEKDVYLWAAGRLFTYGDGTGCADSPNWHRAIFTPRSLEALFKKMGLQDVARLTTGSARGADHGWVSLGMKGRKA